MRTCAAVVLLSVAPNASADCQSDLIPWPDRSGDLFGSGLAADGGQVVVGVPNASLDGLFEHGLVLVSNADGILVELPMLPQESGFLIGSDVAISGGFAFASCTGRTEGFNGNVGGVLVWRQLAPDTWSSPELLSRPDWDDQFFAGYQIAASNGVVAVSVPGVVGGFPAGAGAVDLWSFGGSDASQYVGRVSDGGEPDSFFGASLDLNESFLVVGAPTVGAGRVHIFDRNGTSFAYRGFLEGNSQGDQFGASVFLHNSTLFVGAPRVGASNLGEAYRFAIQDGLPNPNMTYEAPAGSLPNARFGLSVAGDDFHVCATGFQNGHAALWRADFVDGLPDSMITDGFFGRIRDVYADGSGLFYLPDEFSGDVIVLNPRQDCNLNGICDPDEEGPDCNNNGIPDAPCDLVSIGDCDGNGIPDDCQPDCDNDGLIDACDLDDDGDGIEDGCDASSCGQTGPDCNGNGKLDSCDIAEGAADCNMNGIPDSCENLPDCNANGQPDECESFEDCNSNSIPDECELVGNDCNQNGVPDECDLPGNDCDGNSVPDDCDSDCDRDGLPDACERDCNADGIPEDCQELVDCNANGTPDECEDFADCNGNRIPDACDLENNDCNLSGVPDECELDQNDCDQNGVPDECQPDCDGDLIPDSCETDCNVNGVPDDCDIAKGSSEDCDANGVPDECDLADGGADCNGNGVLDVCDIQGDDFDDCNANGVPDECDLGLVGGGEAIAVSFEDFLGSDQLALSDEVPGLEFVGSTQGAPWLIRDVTSGDYNVSSWDCANEADTGLVWGTGLYWICDFVFATTSFDKSGNDGLINIPLGASFFELRYCSYSDLTLTAYDASGAEISRDVQPGNTRDSGNQSGPGTLRVDANGDTRISSVRVADSGNRWLIDSILTDGLYAGSDFDCDGNMIIDECEIAADPSLDCDNSGTLDACDVLNPKSDCNSNGIPDLCDVSSGFSSDCDGNDIPDECQLRDGTSSDCNHNDIPDACEVADGALDQNGNMIPDECECIEDLNTDGFVDLLDVVVLLGQWMTSPDGLPDINGDGMVDLDDLLLVLDAYGPCEL